MSKRDEALRRDCERRGHKFAYPVNWYGEAVLTCRYCWYCGWQERQEPVGAWKPVKPEASEPAPEQLSLF